MVESLGPPRVMIWIGSKIWNAPMKVITEAKNMVGDINGSVMWKNVCNRFAPSQQAASTICDGTVCSPASMIRNV